MTMRVTVENSDESGRVVKVSEHVLRTEPSGRMESQWVQSDSLLLVKGEKRTFMSVGA